MQSFFEWFDARVDKNKPWLILGKGPSFSQRTKFDLRPYYTMSLNHAVRKQRVTVAHIIDYDVVEACEDAIFHNAQFLVLPWFPHMRNRPGHHDLSGLVEVNRVLRTMRDQGRLLWYSHSRAPRKDSEAPIVRVRFFSAVAALNLLAFAGVRKIRSLGIDGGASYSWEFEDLADKTLLSNRRSSFDRQFEEFARTIMVTGVDYAPLDTESPIRVYVGCTESEALPCKVLEYSIRKHASMTVEVFPLHLSGIEIPLPRDSRDHPRTPFSFQRFVIPVLAGYRGRAIYLDSDMQVFKDIRALWTLPFGGADLLAVRESGSSGRRPQFSVMVLDCGSLRWDINEIVKGLDEGRWTYEGLVQHMSVARKVRFDIPAQWNELERFSERDTALLHFTDMNIQPWVSQSNPIGYLWTRTLLAAVAGGFVSLDLVRQEVASGHVRPSLLYQLEHGIEDGLLLPRIGRLMDRHFTPPYRALQNHSRFARPHPGRLLRAIARHYYRLTPLHRYQRLVRDWILR